MKANSSFICEALKIFGTSNAKQLSCFIKRKFDEDISPAAVSGALRGMVAKGIVGSSNCGAGATYYWVNV